MAHGKDRWIRPVEITTANRRIVITENSIQYDVDIATGTYWVYASSAPELTGYPSLYVELVTALGLNTLQPYAFAAADPAGGSNTDKRGLAMSSGGGLDFSLDFSDAGFTFPPELLGFAPDRSADISDTSGTITGDRSLWGVWVSPRWARRKVGFKHKQLNASTEDVHRASAYQMDYGETTRRVFEYAAVPGVLVREAAGAASDYTDVMGLASGDQNTAFETIWSALAELETCLVLHDMGDDADALAITDAEFDGKREYVRLATPDARASLENIAEITHPAGEFWTLTVPTVRIGGDYE